MRSRLLLVAAFGVALLAIVSTARSQDEGREARARDYIRFLVTELDQWTSDMPQVYNHALVGQSIDSTKLSEAQKAAADNLRVAIKGLLAADGVPDLTTNGNFRAQLEKTLGAAKPLNEALGAQRFPASIEDDWAPIRTNLNSLADIYRAGQLVALEIPAAGSGRPRTGAVIPAGAITGYIVDQRCAGSGKAMWTNVQCVARCVRDGDKVVLVTEEGKVYQIANQSKVDQDNYGQKVAISGKTENNEITVDSLQTL